MCNSRKSPVEKVNRSALSSVDYTILTFLKSERTMFEFKLFWRDANALNVWKNPFSYAKKEFIYKPYIQGCSKNGIQIPGNRTGQVKKSAFLVSNYRNPHQVTGLYLANGRIMEILESLKR